MACSLLCPHAMSTPPRRSVIAFALLFSTFALASPPARANDDDSRRARRALQRALELTSLEPGVRVLLIEPDLAPSNLPIGRLDAFVVREPGGALRPIIYINRRSEIVRCAVEGKEFYVFVLAAVIHHEAQHLAGASEAEARRAEFAFFQSLVSRGYVQWDLGFRYLQLLSSQIGTSPSELRHE
jgi:hypothetical protein